MLSYAKEAEHNRRKALDIDWRDTTVRRCDLFVGAGNICQNETCPYSRGITYADGHQSRCVHVWNNIAD